MLLEVKWMVNPLDLVRGRPQEVADRGGCVGVGDGDVLWEEWTGSVRKEKGWGRDKERMQQVR